MRKGNQCNLRRHATGELNVREFLGRSLIECVRASRIYSNGYVFSFVYFAPDGAVLLS
jgi:hypothetical protein